MSYEYTDRKGRNLDAIKHGDNVLLRSKEHLVDRLQIQTVAFAHEDAPGIALAILQAAGYGTANRCFGDGPFEDADSAVLDLKAHQELNAALAARGAEDAKVDEFRRTLYRAEQGVESPTRWSDVVHEGHEQWRAKYRAAREFFTRDEKPAKCCGMPGQCAAACQDEKPAPRVLNYGDPEPDRGTKWQRPSMEMHFDGDHWALFTDKGNIIGYYKWATLPEHCFPMTEVTP